MRDDYGNTLKAGDRLSLSVGIPPREVIVTIETRRGRLVAINDEGSMSLREVLRVYPAEVIR